MTILKKDIGAQVEILEMIGERIVPQMMEVSDEVGLSQLAITCLTMQACVIMLKAIGGPSSRPYVKSMVDGMFCDNDTDGAKIDKAAERYMVRMADYFDALPAQADGLKP